MRKYKIFWVDEKGIVPISAKMDEFYPLKNQPQRDYYTTEFAAVEAAKEFAQKSKNDSVALIVLPVFTKML